MRLPARAARGRVHVIVDTPRGSSQKYKYDARINCFKLSRMLPAGMHFPFDFGAIPGTVGADGDALDVVLVSEHPSFVGCLFEARLIGVIEAQQREGGRTLRNDRLLAVPVSPVNAPLWRELRELPQRMLDELEQFFVSYNRIHGRQFAPLGRRGRAAAERLLEAGVKRHRRSSSQEP
jgi:inorganic pyrophosphatase